MKKRLGMQLGRFFTNFMQMSNGNYIIVVGIYNVFKTGIH